MSDIFSEIQKDFDNLITNCYPTLHTTGASQSGPHFHFRLSNKYHEYQETPFYYENDLKFVHWTTVQNLSSIINNSEIRLYDLHNSADEDEFFHAGKLFSLSDDIINNLKNYYYTASLCEFSDLNTEYLWGEYGRNYKGVVIVFSLINNLKEWENFYMARVFYDLDDSMKSFIKEFAELRKKYNGLSIVSDMWKFAGFYKRNDFHNEKEVRIANIFPFDKEQLYLQYVRRELKIDIARNRIVSYLPLKLWSDPESSYHKEFGINEVNHGNFHYDTDKAPKIKIDSIHFGKNCGLGQDYYSLSDKIKEIISWRLGYYVEILANLHG